MASMVLAAADLAGGDSSAFGVRRQSEAATALWIGFSVLLLKEVISHSASADNPKPAAS
jgi:hypothetical protein